MPLVRFWSYYHANSELMKLVIVGIGVLVGVGVGVPVGVGVAAHPLLTPPEPD